MSSVETDIAVLKRDVSQYAQIVSKLDATLDKLSDISNNVSKILAVHEQKFDALNNADKEMEKRIDSKTNEIRELSNKVDSIKKLIQEELHALEKKFTSELEEEKDKQSKLGVGLHKRLAEIEQWRWIIIGICMSATWLIDKIPKLMDTVMK